MTEQKFIDENQARWETYESKLSSNLKADSFEVANLYKNLTEDLSFARTFFPEGKSKSYLNQLTLKAHQLLYQKTPADPDKFWNFWKSELPLLVSECFPQIRAAFMVFFISCLIGALSAANDAEFVRLILGDSYVNMTLENINQQDPMAVYKDQGQSEMFLFITLNNIKVAFTAFAMGIFFSIGTGLILFYNGVMLGAFQYFFYQKGLFITSFLSIWIHGTLEISAIILAGGAGFIMGNSILFPGTYPRLYSFQNGAKKGAKLVLGLVPIFCLAGFLEGFATRHTEWSAFIKLGIILSSMALILFYFIYLPINTKQAKLNKEKLLIKNNED